MFNNKSVKKDLFVRKHAYLVQQVSLNLSNRESFVKKKQKKNTKYKNILTFTSDLLTTFPKAKVFPEHTNIINLIAYVKSLISCSNDKNEWKKKNHEINAQPFETDKTSV